MRSTTTPVEVRNKISLDPCDEYLLDEYVWYISYCGRQRKHTYAVTKVKGKILRMHRLILNAGAKDYIDHVDGNGLNNCRHNIRICSPQENRMNVARFHSGKSKFKGVTHSGDARRNKPWRTRIRLNDVDVFDQSFHDEFDAALMYDYQIKKLFGNFAFLNFPCGEA
jgi:hypothetical protein